MCCTCYIYPFLGATLKARHGHDSSDDVNPAKGNCPLEHENEQLVLLDDFNVHLFRHIQFRMIFFFRGEVTFCLGLQPKMRSYVQEFLNILPWGHAHGSIFISYKVTTQMEADGACTLELELTLVLQQVSDGFWVLGG